MYNLVVSKFISMFFGLLIPYKLPGIQFTTISNIPLGFDEARHHSLSYL
jgi:hypothetical protein